MKIEDEIPPRQFLAMFTVVYAMYSSDKETGKVQFSEVARLLIQNNVPVLMSHYTKAKFVMNRD